MSKPSLRIEHIENSISVFVKDYEIAYIVINRSLDNVISYYKVTLTGINVLRIYNIYNAKTEKRALEYVQKAFDEFLKLSGLGEEGEERNSNIDG